MALTVQQVQTILDSSQLARSATSKLPAIAKEVARQLHNHQAAQKAMANLKAQYGKQQMSAQHASAYRKLRAERDKARRFISAVEREFEVKF